MKRFLFSLLTLVLATGIGFADVIEKTYQFGSPRVMQTDGYQTIQFENALITGIPGEPALPYFSVSLLLPPGQAAAGIEIIPGEEVVLEGNYELYPMQHSQPVSKGESGTFAFNKQVYQSDAPYPENISGVLTTQYLNGYAIALTTFTPVRYNPASGKVSYYKSVTVKISSAANEKAVEALENLQSTSGVLKRVAEIAQNTEALKSYPVKELRDESYQMVIITSSQWADDFQELVDFYLPRGIITQIATTEDIYSTMAGQDNQEKIRNYIIQEYQNHGIEYAFLGGDVEIIPYRGFYCTVQSSSVYTDDNIPADLYYSGLDGTWNDNGNSWWGEIGEDDLFPEIGVGRFSFSNQSDLDALLHKIISYQESPVLGELHNPLLAGEWLYSSPETWGSDYLELLIGYHDDNGYTTIGIPEDDEITKLYDKNGTWSANQLIQEINEGHNFIHHVGHANTNYTMKMYDSYITNSNFSQVNGETHNYTLIFSHGCICGAFDATDCIAEKMIDINNFAVTVWMNSRYGWFNEGQTEGPAAHINRELVDALYNEKEGHAGMAYSVARIATAPWVTAPGQWEEGALRWNFYDCNVLGGTALNIWTDEPLDITANYQETLPIGVPSITVTLTGNGSPAEAVKCVFVMDGTVYGMATTNEAGTAEIVFTEPVNNVGDATIYISGYNCLLQGLPVTVIPNSGAYVVYNSSTINDENGNNNGQADYNESILLTTEMKNVGTVQADNVTVTLSSEDSYVTITDATEDFGNIAGGATVSIENAFAFDIAAGIPDQHVILFNLEAEGEGKDTWASSFSITANAPALELDNYLINDANGGNNNGILDPGETADIIVTAINNGGADAYEVNSTLSSSDPYITVNTTTPQEIGNLSAGATGNATFSITADAGTPAGYTASIDLLFEAMYGVQQQSEIALPFTDYCIPEANCSYGDGLTGFALENINNMNSGCSPDGYGNFTDMSTDLQPGDTYTVSLQTGYDSQMACLWIDFNSNKEFEEDEMLINDFNLASSGQIYTVDITIPPTTNGGMKRMRVRANWQNSAADPCEDFSYGETEDYTVNIVGGALTVYVSCNPAEICLGESSELLALAGGGSGNYTYQWTPETGLNDPTAYNPIATPEETTTYTVEVNDGNEITTGQVTVTVHPVPETPTITLVENTLYSSAEEGNQWYDSEGMIPGANGQSYTPTVEDDYYVIVSNEFGCQSQPSNTIHVIITGINEQSGNSQFTIYPNPFNDKVNIEVYFRESVGYKIAVFNALGAEVSVVAQGVSQSNDIRKFTFSSEGLEEGIYFCKIITGDDVMIRKIVHTK